MTSPSSSTTRLHITPFTSELLPLVLPASTRPLATEISFHCIPTFPENNYGYVTLPAMEADKIKKKLNGSILKGRKFKVEAAYPQKGQRNEDDEQGHTPVIKPSSSKKSKKRKAEDNILDGYELPSGRKVKRGWTESANEKVDRRKKEKKAKSKDEKKTRSQAKSKYTEKEECLFRAKVPANKSSPADEKSAKSKKKKKSSQEAIVHEFSKTLTHPTFLRSEDNETVLTSTFEEGKGWLDVSGNLKENISDRIRKEQYRPGQIAGHKEKAIPSRSGTRAGKTSAHKSKNQSTGSSEKIESSDESEDWTSSSGSSSSEDDSMDSESDESASSSSSEESDVAYDDGEQQLPVPNPQSAKNDTSLVAELETAPEGEVSTEPEGKQPPKEVHPLEALFKKPASIPLGESPDTEPPAQFSFFGQEDLESEGETQEPVEPLTPFAKIDLQGRGLRSAAPTPDTAHIGRTINWNISANSSAGEASLNTSSPAPKAGMGPNEESDFSKWFWENRGDNNRAWKRRRRDVAKEQRQRENRRTGMKGKS